MYRAIISHMNLHRTTGKPDWEGVASGEYNIYQRVAVATHGTVTPANVVTLIGLVMVIVGLLAIVQGDLWFGIALVLSGRLLDVADGAIADATHTKSPLGELWDAAADKAGTVLTIAAMWYANIVNVWVIAVLVLPQLIIPLVIYVNRRRGIRVHPTRIGKLGMASTWVCIGVFFVAAAMQGPPVLVAIGYGLAAASVVLTFIALWQYATGRD